MKDSTKPKTVKVTVHSSRNLRQRKTQEDPFSWAIFGFGKDKCCTAQVRDRNASWNEESTFTLPENNKAPFKIIVKDKDEVLGQIQVPVADIPSDEHFPKWMPLTGNKKASKVQGELCVDYWVQDFHQIYNTPPAAAGGQKGLLKNMFNGRSPNSARKEYEEMFENHATTPTNDRRYSIGSGLTSIKGSVSMEDISRQNSPFATKHDTFFRAKTVSGIDVSRHELRLAPVFESIVPDCGPCTGDTLIQISGKHLGTSREDIIRLTVSGCNCTNTLEYYNPNKIICRTSKSHVSKGPVMLQTRSGGTTTSDLLFTFEGDDDADEVDENSNHTKARRLHWDETIPEENEDCSGDVEIDRLRATVQMLTMENQELREYVDRLTVYLLDKYPHALESSKMYHCN